MASPSPSELPADFGRLPPRLVAPLPGPQSRELARRLARVESRNVTFLGEDATGSDSGGDPPIFWTEARGANVRDADGNRYLDLTGAFGVAVAGHAHPAVVAAMQAQAARLIHGMGDVHPPEIKVRLLERLAALAPWSETRGFLANSGSEAVEAALKTALLATGRPGILAFEGGYHGLTLGSLAATSRRDFREPFAAQLHGGVRFAPFPDAMDALDASGQVGVEDPRGVEAHTLAAALDRVEAILEEAAGSVAPVGAVIVEPIQGRAGVRVPVPGFLAGLAERARAHGAVVIHDEIFSGLGRTGTVWAAGAEGADAVPDLLCVGKALGGGLPLSACLGRAEVMDAWPRSHGEALHTSTFLGHPLACATALAFLDVLEGEGLMGRAREIGEDLRRGLEAELGQGRRTGPEGSPGLRGLRGLRGRGGFLGVVLDGPGVPPAAGVRVAAEALRRGVILLPAGPEGGVVELSPPLVLTAEQTRVAVDVVATAIRVVLQRDESVRR